MDITVRTFETGATRTAGDKPEYAGYLSPRVIISFGQFMLKHQQQVDGTFRDCRNWQKGIPLESYMQSMSRHYVEVWDAYEKKRDGLYYDAPAMIESLMALLFNVQGMTHELLGE